MTGENTPIDPIGESDIGIEDLIPHRGRMKLIDGIIHLDFNQAISRAVVKDSWPLFGGGGVKPLILVELAAQTAGLCNGFERIHVRGVDSSQQGFIVGIKKAVFSIDVIPEGTEIVTLCENTFKYDNFREIQGVSRIGSDIVGETVLQLFQAGNDG
jgi:predicted hotdog family 3-hydroxylacyl-ACP dehydratase